MPRGAVVDSHIQKFSYIKFFCSIEKFCNWLSSTATFAYFSPPDAHVPQKLMIKHIYINIFFSVPSGSGFFVFWTFFKKKGAGSGVFVSYLWRRYLSCWWFFVFLQKGGLKNAISVSYLWRDKEITITLLLIPPKGGQNLYDYICIQRAGALTRKNWNSKGELPPAQKQPQNKHYKRRIIMKPQEKLQ